MECVQRVVTLALYLKLITYCHSTNYLHRSIFSCGQGVLLIIVKEKILAVGRCQGCIIGHRVVKAGLDVCW